MLFIRCGIFHRIKFACKRFTMSLVSSTPSNILFPFQLFTILILNETWCKTFLCPNNVGAIKFYNMYSFRGKSFPNYVIGHSHLILKAFW